jgi:large subunit ribosomal protein L9
MNIILLEKIRNLGALGDEVKVKPGYARNYLLPYRKAVIANEANRATFEAKRIELEKHQTEVLSAAQARAEKLNGASISISAKAGDEGKLFGSVGAREIADALTAAGMPIERSEVLLPEGPIKELGTHDIELALHPEVTVSITVSVAAE